MSANICRVALFCNHNNPGPGPMCFQALEVEALSISEARAKARAQGWTVNVHSPHTRRNRGFDYCPKHKPEGR